MKTKVLLAAFVALATSSLHADNYSDYVTGLNPTIYYRLDQTPITAPAVPTVGTTAPNLGGGGAPLDGYYQSYGGSTVLTTGTSSGAIAGNAGIDVTGWAVSTPTFALASGSTAFSFKVWAKPTSFGVGDSGMVLGYGNGVPDGNSMLLYEDGVAGTGKLDFDRMGNLLFTSTASMTAGLWNSIGVTFNGSDTIKLYLNGALDTTYTGVIDPFGNQYATFGNFYQTGTVPFAGGLDEFSYFTGTTLSDTQMINLGNATIPEPSVVSFLILGLGGLAALSFRRYKAKASAAFGK
jgi:hypothetical protein